MSQEKGQCRVTIEQVAQRLWVPGAVGRAKATAAVGDERHCVVSTVFQTCMSHNFDLSHFSNSDYSKNSDYFLTLEIL